MEGKGGVFVVCTGSTGNVLLFQGSRLWPVADDQRRACDVNMYTSPSFSITMRYTQKAMTKKLWVLYILRTVRVHAHVCKDSKRKRKSLLRHKSLRWNGLELSLISRSRHRTHMAQYLRMIEPSSESDEPTEHLVSLLHFA